MKPTIRTSGVVPYKGGRILIQERARSKNGEKYAFFGGRIEKGEAPLEAAKREAREELEFEFDEYVMIGRTKKVQSKQIVIEYTFMTPYTDASKFRIHEGKSIKEVTVNQARRLSMNPGDDKILDKIEKYLENAKSG